LAYTPQSWRKLYSLVDKQMAPLHRLSWCEKTRHLMQQRLIELSSEDDSHRCDPVKERSDIENALRNLWRIEQKARKTIPEAGNHPSTSLSAIHKSGT
jgi:hypothetical protein